VILSNLELCNSRFIAMGISQSDRLILLNKMANEEKAIWSQNQVALMEKQG
jgi:hypothetical protein